MAIEIRELKIKGYIDKQRNVSQSSGLSQRDIAKLKKSIVRECVQEVIDRLERKSRR